MYVCMHARVGEEQREREREREREGIPGRVHAISTETNSELYPMNLEIMT